MLNCLVAFITEAFQAIQPSVACVAMVSVINMKMSSLILPSVPYVTLSSVFFRPYSLNFVNSCGLCGSCETCSFSAHPLFMPCLSSLFLCPGYICTSLFFISCPLKKWVYIIFGYIIFILKSLNEVPIVNRGLGISCLKKWTSSRNLFCVSRKPV